jgi:hypothetical protein
MKGLNLNLTKSEVTSLMLLLWFSEKACSSGCIYLDMEKNKLNCKDCRYTRDMKSIMNKLEGG